jgi:hypothetical protein
LRFLFGNFELFLFSFAKSLSLKVGCKGNAQFLYEFSHDKIPAFSKQKKLRYSGEEIVVG